MFWLVVLTVALLAALLKRETLISVAGQVLTEYSGLVIVLFVLPGGYDS